MEKFTFSDLKNWEPHIESYFLDILNGDYDLNVAIEDLDSFRKD